MADTPQSRSTRVPPQGEPETYAPPPRRRSGAQRQGIGEAMLKSFIRSIASSIGRTIVRTITRRLR